MRVRTSAGVHAFQFFNCLFMAALVIVTLYPFLYIVFASVSEPSQIIKHTGILYGSLGFTLKAYELVLKNPSILSGYMNTLFIVVAGTAVNMVLTAFLAYALSRRNLFWAPVLMGLVVFTMFFDGGIIPRYLLVKRLGLLDSLFSVILPTAINTMNLIIMRTAFKSLPDSLEESAYIDGANDFVILFRIVIPLSMAVMAVLVLYYAVAHWNSWFSASIYLQSRSKLPLQVILREILIINSSDSMMGDVQIPEMAQMEVILKYAAIIVSTLPILMLYPFLQRYFIKGVMIGALKG